MDSRLAHVRLEIELDSEPIAGMIAARDEPPRCFRGWIELAELIERARKRATAAGETLGPVPGAKPVEL